MAKPLNKNNIILNRYNKKGKSFREMEGSLFLFVYLEIDENV